MRQYKWGPRASPAKRVAWVGDGLEPLGAVGAVADLGDHPGVLLAAPADADGMPPAFRTASLSAERRMISWPTATSSAILPQNGSSTSSMGATVLEDVRVFNEGLPNAVTDELLQRPLALGVHIEQDAGVQLPPQAWEQPHLRFPRWAEYRQDDGGREDFV